MKGQIKYQAWGLLLAAAILTACSSDVVETAQPKTWHVSIPVDEAVTRSVYPAGTTLKSKWNSSQPVEAYSGETKVGDLTASANATGGTTTITGDVSGTYTTSSTLTLYSPSKDASYTTQDGTVDGTNGISSKDYLTATVNVTAVNGSSGLLSTSRAAFSRLQSFTKFTFTEAVHSVVISASDMDAITVTAESGDQTDFYVALPLAGSVEYTFVATTATNIVYYGRKQGNLTHGRYYTASVDLLKELDVTATISSWGDDETLPSGDLPF